VRGQNTLTALAGDLLATRAGELLEQLACGKWGPATKLREALQCYSEVRLGTTVAEQVDVVCSHGDAWDEPAPKPERSVLRG
jgi:hypothetical protein